MLPRGNLRLLVAVVIAVAMVCSASITGSAAASAKAGATATPAPVSNAFAMGGTVGGQIDQRTGAFQASMPLLNIAGRAGTNLSLSLSYDQNLAVQGAAGNRFGFGSGWALGIPWVDTVGGVRVYAAAGGSYLYDTGSPTGLHDYPLRDLTFAKAAGTLPARAGVPQARSYSYTLKYYDGETDYFDSTGNLLEQADRFGNHIDLSWRPAGQSWQPTSAVDNYGDVTTFDYSTPGQVKVTAPENAEGIAASTTLSVHAGMLNSVTDASGAVTSFTYTSVGSVTSQLLHTVTSPDGARTTVAYTALSYEPGVVVVNTVQVTDKTGLAVQTERTFSANPRGNTGDHNYTGYPTWNKAGTDGLFDSGDHNYRYSTSLSDGRSSVIETYNNLQLLTTRVIQVTDPVLGTVVQQTQGYTYPSVSSVQALPANYAKPTGTTVVYGVPHSSDTRTTSSSSTYDDRGELTSTTDEAGTVTKTQYDPTFGVPLKETTTGADGTTSVTTNTLTPDNSAVQTSSTAVGPTAKTATARTVTTYSYDDFGEVTKQSVAWAPGAKPTAATGGPDQIDSSRQITVDTVARTRTVIQTQAAGTPDAAATTTVTDLITGNVLSTTNPDQLTTSYTYDALGRVTSRTDPGDRTTTTTYPTPLVTDVTDPTGHTTETTVDALGRTVKVTDNVDETGTGTEQKLVLAPNKVTARTLTVNTYSVDGSTSTSTPTTGATTTTTYDPLQRPIKVVKPDGLTETIAYNDVANTKTTSIFPKQATAPTAVTVQDFDNLNRTLSMSSTYPDKTPQTPTTQSYDGLGRVSAFSSEDVTATPQYTGAGGLQNQVNLTPTNTTSFPGGTEVSATTNTMTGALNTKTLTDNASTGATSTSGATLTYDDAGRVATATDPSGGTTSYTYTLGGKPAKVTSPSGTVTTYTYSPTTGQLVEKDLSAPGKTTQKTAYTYYPDSGLVETIYDPDHPSDVIKYQYDPDGHTIGVQYPDGTSSTALYALNGELATATDITGAVTTYAYDSDGILGGATQTHSGTQIADVTYAYDSLDRVHTITRGNGTTTTITYSDANQITDEVTSGPDKSVLRDDSYSYDAHGNTATHTITKGTGVTTTGYGYDAYDRLVSSSIYPSATATGTPTSTTTYGLNAAGDVTNLTTTANGTTSTTVNKITAGDQLTTQTVNGTATSQTYNTDGTVHQDLNGNVYQYDVADQLTSVTTLDGTSTNYAYWPDGSRRSTSTTVNGATNTTTLHYDTTGRLANDTYTDSTTGSTPQTASYLFGVNRESRSSAANVLGSPAPPTGCPKHHPHQKCHKPKPKPCHQKKGCHTHGTPPALGASAADATDYYVDDAHGSVVSMTDAGGTVSASYQYGDYGQPLTGTNPAPAAPAGPAATAAGNATVNPFTYNGAYTDPTTGNAVLAARTYDPTQGRFLSLDGSDMLNRYQAFDTNPINNVDPSGHAAIPDIATDAVSAVLFMAFAVLSLVPVLDVIVAPAEATMTAMEVASAAANVVSAAANAGATITSTALTIDDGDKMAGGTGLFNDTQRDQWNTANFALGAIAGVAGVAGGVAGYRVGQAAEAELSTTKTSLATREGDLTSITSLSNKTRGLLSETETRLANTTETLKNTQAELNSAQTALDTTQGQLTDAQEELFSERVNLSDTQDALDNARAEMATMQTALNDANGQVDVMAGKLATAEGTLPSTQNQPPVSAKQVANLTAQLAVAGESTERLATQDPHAGAEPAPTGTGQGAGTPIDNARNLNDPLSTFQSDFGQPGF